MTVHHLVFLDLETTGLADECPPWEIGLIRRPSGLEKLAAADRGDPPPGDVEFCWQLRPELANAEPDGLRVGRYYERLRPELRALSPGHGWTVVAHQLTTGIRIEGRDAELTWDIAAKVAGLLDGATLVGAVPDFDARHLNRWLRAHGQAPAWHYHLVDVETLAAGALRLPPPWDFDQLLGRYALRYKPEDRHTALGDARMARDLYDAVMTGEPKPTPAWVDPDMDEDGR